ncbi:hypothetical protein AYO47_09585 [Planctomyces sp. SCGC AG-212-M04]|nr:hypothetical protein AYO47_09585 [Planctomyces sp. SCGC AG-212-M04]
MQARRLDTMKRIVTFLLPVREGGSSLINGADEHLTTALDERELDSPAQSPGTMRVEVIVSDEAADRVINTLLGHDNSHPDSAAAASPSIDPVQQLVSRELEGMGADADSLLERIISRVERQLIVQVYQDCDRIKSRAAIRLGINRNTLLKKLRQYHSLTEEADEPDAVALDSSGPGAHGSASQFP